MTTDMDLAQAKAFIDSSDFSGIPRGPMTQGADARDVFDAAKQQAQVVGSGVFSFAVGVTPDVRKAISDSALFAQLVASANTSPEAEPIKWFNEYSSALQRIGWTLQEAGWTDYSTSGKAAEVHEKIMEIVAVTLGPSAAALAIIGATVGALKAMQSDSQWLTLFSRESQKARIGRFQIGFVEKEEDADVFVSLLACLVIAKKNITQILVFKWRAESASFQANGAKVSINRQALLELGPIIRKKTRAYQLDYVSSAFDLPETPAP
jgi:hypothetical protein